MKVLVTDNAHLYKTPDEKYYTSAIYGYDFFKRYLDVFDEVRFVAKTKHVNNIDVAKYILVSGDNLEIYEIPWYQGLKEMFGITFKLIYRYQKASEGCDCCIYRIAQIESFFAYIFSNKNKPFALEMVNDPQSFKNINCLCRNICCVFTKYLINKANGVSYVTKKYLQDKYPRKYNVNADYFESSYSSIDIDNIVEINDINKNIKNRVFKIVHVSNNINNYMKGHMVLLRTIKYIVDAGYDINLTFIGDGELVSEFKKNAIKLGIQNKVNFLGKLNSKEDVMVELSKYDLFVFPSSSEGLPRVVIEAQAAGLPCLSSNVGGIPELINEKYLHKPDDFKAFGKSIIRLINTPSELGEMRAESIKNAASYTNKKLQEKRNSFYMKLKLCVLKNKGL